MIALVERLVPLWTKPVDSWDDAEAAFRFISPLETVAPTGHDIEVRTIDVLTITGGVISAIWVVSDDLSCFASSVRTRWRDRRGD